MPAPSTRPPTPSLDEDAALLLRTLYDHLGGLPSIQLTDAIILARQVGIPGDGPRGAASERLKLIIRILVDRGHVRCPAGRPEMVTLTDRGALYTERQLAQTSR